MTVKLLSFSFAQFLKLNIYGGCGVMAGTMTNLQKARNYGRLEPAGCSKIGEKSGSESITEEYHGILYARRYTIYIV